MRPRQLQHPARMRRFVPRPVSARSARLTLRELEVLQLIADGLESTQIARALYISDDTVKTHVAHVLNKLGATSRANAVAIGIRSGLIG
jgi:two-component system, NarL family, nitrate/nitrite response regulator NarL